MGVRLDTEQQIALARAKSAQGYRREYEKQLGQAVTNALLAGVPLNTLATALGVSRSRVRRLARVEKSE